MKDCVTDIKKKIRRQAINLLSRREHTCYELTVKLKENFKALKYIEEVVGNLSREGLQSDSRFAESFIRYRFQKGFGPIRIRKELLERGIGEELLDKSLESADYNWEQHASEVLEKKFGNSICGEFKETAKRIRFLEQRGFSLEQCHQSLNL